MKEYGRKPYLCKSYHEIMNKTSNSSMWNQIKQKHSEFEKPYFHRAGEYAEMQHYFPNLPGLSGIPSFSLSGVKFDDMRFDHPWMGRPVDDALAWPTWMITFFCRGDPCWCPNQTKCFDMGCTYPVVNVTTDFNSCEGADFTFGNGQLCITAGDSVNWSCSITIHMAYRYYNEKLKKKVTIIGTHGGIRINQCSDDDCISCDCTDITISYTTQQMAVDEVQTLTVTNGTADCTYDWAIDSGGGSLSAATGLSVDYTAPSSNAECAENSIISLSVEGNVCDTLALAINAGVSGTAYWKFEGTVFNDWYYFQPFRCDDSRSGGGGWYPDPSSPKDVRTSAMITEGCCPAGLL